MLTMRMEIGNVSNKTKEIFFYFFFPFRNQNKYQVPPERLLHISVSLVSQAYVVCHSLEDISKYFHILHKCHQQR